MVVTNISISTENRKSKSVYCFRTILDPRRCKTSSVGQSAGLSILRSSVRFRPKIKKKKNSNLHVLEVHRHTSKGTKLLLQVIKAIINQLSFLLNFQIGPSQISQSGCSDCESSGSYRPLCGNCELNIRKHRKEGNFRSGENKISFFYSKM